jgi:hypothetical protein
VWAQRRVSLTQGLGCLSGPRATSGLHLGEPRFDWSKARSWGTGSYHAAIQTVTIFQVDTQRTSKHMIMCIMRCNAALTTPLLDVSRGISFAERPFRCTLSIWGIDGNTIWNMACSSMSNVECRRRYYPAHIYGQPSRSIPQNRTSDYKPGTGNWSADDHGP